MHNKVPKNEYLNKKGYAPKKNPEKIVNEGVIYDPRGQWAFPGEVTKIPSGDITMQGVSYPVLGVDDLGNEQMMYPGFDYTFPGNTVTEYPQLQYGGDPSIPDLTQAKKGGWLNKYSKMPKKKSSKNIKSSINKLMTRNPLFDRNYMLYGAKGPRLYDPNSKYQDGGAKEPIYVSSPLDPRYQAYSDSLSLYNNYKKRVDTKGGTLRDTFAIDDVHFTPGAIYNETDRIKPTGIEWHEGGYGRSGDTFIPAYKKPVQQVVVKKVVKKTPEQKARELKPIESKLTPMEVAPEPALYKAPAPTPKYAYMPTNFGPVYYYEWDAQQNKWVPINQQSYNYNTESGTKNTQLYDSKPPGFKQGGWLNQYQSGGITINSEEEYRKSLLMKNKTKERIDAERAWAAKKVAAANQAKTQQPSGIPLPQGNQPYTYNWSAADIRSKPGPVATPQVVMTSTSLPQHDYIREAKVNKAMAEAKEKKDAADLQVQKDQYGNTLGTLRYYANKTEEWAEGDEGSKYYYKDPDTGQMRSFSEVGAYEQVGVPLQDAAYGSFPLFEGAAFIASPIKKGLSKAIAPSVEYLTSKTPLKGFKSTPKQLPGSPNAVQSLEEQMMSLNAPKGNMYGQNQVLTQQSRLLHPSTKAKYFKYQAPLVEPKITTDIFGNKFWKAPKDYRNRITPENYEEFVNNIHGSTEYGIAESTGFQPGNLGVGNYGKPGMVFSDASLNNLGKDIINAHEKNHGMFVGTMSKEQTNNLLKPFGTKKPIPGYGAKQQADEVLARMGQFKNAVGIGDDQVFTLGHLNLIRKNYANSFLDNGITEMLAKIKPGSIGEKLFLINMNKYAFGIAPIAIGAAAIPAAISSRKAFKKGGSPRKSSKKLVNYSQNHNFVKTQSNSWLDKYK